MNDAAERAVPRLMLVAETAQRRAAWPLPELVAAAVAGGVDAVRLVAGDGSRSVLAAAAARLREIVAGRAALIVEGDAALATELGFGLHLPERGPATGAARRRLGERALLGRSVGSAAAATAAIGADYLVAEPIFAGARAGARPLGLSGLGGIVEATWSPVLAGGGVEVEAIADVLAAGAHGVAVGGAIGAAADPERAARGFRAALAAAVPEPIPGPTPARAAPAIVPIVVNGAPVAVESETTVTDLLEDEGLAAAAVVVAVNGRELARRLFDETVLAAGDRVELAARSRESAAGFGPPTGG